jgi:hypothetical protein
MISRYIAAGTVGFAAGVFWLMVVGIPPFNILPSYMDLREEVTAAKSIAEGQAGAFDESEGLRAVEDDNARAAVSDERGTCRARLDAQAAGFDRAMQGTINYYEGLIDDPDLVPDRTIRPVGRVFDDAPPLDEG